MIKRPFLWCAAFYFAGSIMAAFLYNFFFSWKHFLIIAFFISGFFYLLLFFISKENLFFALPVFFFISFLRTITALYPDSLEANLEENQKAMAEGTIYKIEQKAEKQIIYLKTTTIKIDTKEKVYKNKKIFASFSNRQDFDTLYKIGNQVLISGKLIKFQKASNFGQFDEKKYYMGQGIHYKFYGEDIKIIQNNYNLIAASMQKLKNKLSTIYSQIADSIDSGIVKAMVLGEKSETDEEIKQLYRKNGIAHVLAISGLHISLLGMTCYQLLRKIGVPIFFSVGTAILFLICYGYITNFSVSSTRAICMLSISLIAKLVGRTYDLLSSLAVCLLVLLIQNPLQIYDSGFWLSFGAVWAVGFVNPIICDSFYRKEKTFRFLKSFGFFASFSIFLVTLPIILNTYYEFPLYGVFLNLIIIPFMSLIMPLSLLAGIFGMVHISIGQFFMGGVHYILFLYEKICSLVLKLPYSNIVVGKPSLIQIVLYYIILISILFLFHYLSAKNLFSRIIFISFLFLNLIWIRFPNNKLTIEFLDVGQGDSICIQTPSRKVYTIDGGSSDIKQVGKYRLEPYLKAKGISRIHYAILTHMDEDHTNGMIELLQKSREEEGNIKIDNIVITKEGLEQEKHQKLEFLAKKHGASILYIEKGDKIYDKEVILECLHPSSAFLSNSENSYSIVLGLTYFSFSALFTGDLEKDGEALLKQEKLNPYTVLKVAHHGSKYSTDIEFLKKINPIISVISCGKKNRYGHPHKELIERLKKEGGEIKTTMQSGAIKIEIDKNKKKISTFLNNENK